MIEIFDEISALNQINDQEIHAQVGEHELYGIEIIIQPCFIVILHEEKKTQAHGSVICVMGLESSI